jgi:hypothetical protein
MLPRTEPERRVIQPGFARMLSTRISISVSWYGRSGRPGHFIFSCQTSTLQSVSTLICQRWKAHNRHSSLKAVAKQLIKFELQRACLIVFEMLAFRRSIPAAFICQLQYYSASGETE